MPGACRALRYVGQVAEVHDLTDALTRPYPAVKCFEHHRQDDCENGSANSAAGKNGSPLRERGLCRHLSHRHDPCAWLGDFRKRIKATKTRHHQIVQLLVGQQVALEFAQSYLSEAALAHRGLQFGNLRSKLLHAVVDYLLLTGKVIDDALDLGVYHGRDTGKLGVRLHYLRMAGGKV